MSIFDELVEDVGPTREHCSGTLVMNAGEWMLTTFSPRTTAQRVASRDGLVCEILQFRAQTCVAAAKPSRQPESDLEIKLLRIRVASRPPGRITGLSALRITSEPNTAQADTTP